MARWGSAWRWGSCAAMGVLVHAGAEAACLPDAAARVAQASGQVEHAFSTLDDAAFDAAAAELAEQLPCVRAVLTPVDAARVHRAQALVAFVGGDASGSGRAWGAVRALQPAWEPSASLLPADHPARRLWEQAQPGARAHTLGAHPGGEWLVDGAPAAAVPAERAFVLQGVDAAGGVVHSGYHWSPATLPVLSAPPVGEPQAAAPTAAVAPAGRRKGALAAWGTAGGLALGSAGALAVGLSAREAFTAEGASERDDLESLARRANVGIGAGVGLGAGALAAAGVGVALTW